MKHLVIVAFAVAALAATFASTAWAAHVPADRVVVMYFHRTHRCPTCLKMGSYAEEAVKKGFARQVKDRKVEFHYIDFQNKKNAAFKKGYRVSGPALIVAKVVKNKVAKFEDLKDIWTKVHEKPKFIKYVRGNVEACLKQSSVPPRTHPETRSGDRAATE